MMQEQSAPQPEIVQPLVQPLPPQVAPQLPPETFAADRLTSSRSLYDASAGEIFWRHFLAGASRALGTVFIYTLFLILTTYLTLRYVWPQIQPLFATLTQGIEALQTSQQSLQQTQSLIPLLNSSLQNAQTPSSNNSLSPTATPYQYNETLTPELDQQLRAITQ